MDRGSRNGSTQGMVRLKQKKYTEVIANHFDFRHIVDDHNNLRHQVPSIEQTWTTHRWATRVFAFLLALTEVNCYLAFRYFVWKNEEKMGLQEFRGILGWALIENTLGDEVTDPRRRTRSKRKRICHKLSSAPKFAKRFCDQNWVLGNKQAYQQYLCRTPKCPNKVRTYCDCSVGEWLCKFCFVDHIRDSEF